MCVAPHVPRRLSHRDIGDLQKNGLPWDWVEVTDPATGATSYRSDHANCTQPQKPDRPAVSPPPHTSHLFWNMHTHKHTQHMQHTAQPLRPYLPRALTAHSQLPKGWIACWDEGSGQFYFQNLDLQETTWDPPTF